MGLYKEYVAPKRGTKAWRDAMTLALDDRFAALEVDREPDDTKRRAMLTVQERLHAAAVTVDACVPPGRGRALAIGHLEMAMHAAIEGCRGWD